MTSALGPWSAFASSRNGLHAPSRRWQSCANSLSGSKLGEPTLSSAYDRAYTLKSGARR
jgi:hypothetical protein